MDTTEIGIVAAKVMEDLDQDIAQGELPEDAVVVSALVVYEVTAPSGDTDDSRLCTVGLRVSSDRSTMALGLIERARDVLLTHYDGD